MWVADEQNATMPNIVQHQWRDTWFKMKTKALYVLEVLMESIISDFDNKKTFAKI